MTTQPDLFGTKAEGSKEYPSGVDPYEFGGKEWRCWVVDGGARYEWRTACGRYAVWRDARVFRARRGTQTSEREFGSLVTAMQAALSENKSR